MAALTTQIATHTGVSPTFSAATVTTGDTVEVGSSFNKNILIVKTAGTATSVAIAVPGNTDYGQPTSDVTIAVGSTDEKVILLHPSYADGTGRCTVICTPVTAVTLCAVAR
jgi:hypothetical protein